MRSISSANNLHEIIRLTCSMLCAQIQISRTQQANRLDSQSQLFAKLKKQGKNQQDQHDDICSCALAMLHIFSLMLLRLDTLHMMQTFCAQIALYIYKLLYIYAIGALRVSYVFSLSFLRQFAFNALILLRFFKCKNMYR